MYAATCMCASKVCAARYGQPGAGGGLEDNPDISKFVFNNLCVGLLDNYGCPQISYGASVSPG